jgi:Leucine-rich repeat (LRR) protein
MGKQQFENFITQLSNLPHLQRVDLQDNNLTDEQKRFIREKL